MRSVTVSIRIADLHPVRSILAASAGLASAVEKYIASNGIEDEPEMALRDYKATVRAQSEDRG